MGRPKKPIDEKQLEALAERQWSDVQIAAFFEIHVTNLEKRFASKIAECRQRGKAKLLDVLWQRGVQEKSDRVLTHLADRVLGPIPKHIRLEDVSDEQLEKVLDKKIEAAKSAKLSKEKP
jgi:hypothetical protein